MHHSEDKQDSSSSPGAAEVGGGDMTVFQSQATARRNSKDHGVEDPTFASAMDLSGVLDSSQISTSSGDSNSSSSSSHHYSSSELSSSLSISNSTSASISVHSNSSSDSGKAGGQSRGRKVDKDTNLVDKTVSVASGESPVFATCSTFSSSSSTSTASASTTVRRSESWGALRSASVESSKSSGSDKENSITSGDFKSTSMSSMTKDPQNQHSNNESHHNLETYHTPSASMHGMHSITPQLPKLSRSSSSNNQRHPGGDDKKSSGKLKSAKQTEDLLIHLTEEKKDLSNATFEALVQEEETIDESQLQLPASAISPSIDEKQVADGKTEKNRGADKVERKLSSVITPESIMGMGVEDFAELAAASLESYASKDGSNGISPTTKELAKAAKIARKPAKKRNWYQQIFSASYKSRSGDFKKLFKELPIKERLLVDYSCALQKEILVQGRMYVSQGYLSFHANIFGWETQTSLRLRDITSITKEKTALVIPNAIQVVVDGGEKLFFTSFVTRDATYMMLFKLWQNALLEDGMPSKEIQRLIHTSYGEELVITSDDEIDDSLSCKSTIVGADLADSPNIIAVCRQSDGSKSIVIDSSKVNANEIGPAIIVTGTVSSSIASPKSKENGSPIVGLEPSDLSESSDSDEEFQAAEGMEEIDSMDIPLCPVSHTEGRETINAIIPCNIDQLFTMLFTSSKFYLDFHTSRKTFNIQQAPWEFGKDGKQTRQVSMTVSLNAVMGPKHSQITETQIMDTVSKPGLFYVIDCESVNAGIPYADTFYVTLHFCLSRVAATETRLAVVADVKYKKSGVFGFIKAIIEKNAWAGIEEFYSHLERALKEECTKMMLGGSPLPSPKHSSGSNAGRRRPPRSTNKRQAPGIPVSVPPASCRSSLRTGSGLGLTDTPSLSSVPELHTQTPLVGEGSLFLKMILCVLGGLLVLNAFLYFKLTALETTTTSSTLFPPPSFTFTGEMPQNHQDWLLLLQKQESLHRIELQKWHEILMSALKILHQAESDLEGLKFHIGSYSGGKYSVESNSKQPLTASSLLADPQKSHTTSPNEDGTTGDSINRQLKENRVEL